MPEVTTLHALLEMLNSITGPPPITTFATQVMSAIMFAGLLLMATGEPILKSLARVAKRRIGNGGDTELHGVLRYLHSPEVIMIGTAICIYFVYLNLLGGSSRVTTHVGKHIGWHEAALVSALMFQSSQLERFVDHIMLKIQTWTRGKDGEIDERWFTFWALMFIGVLASILSEVAVAASVTAPFIIVNRHQTKVVKAKLGVLLAAAIGIGGGLTNFAAPSIVVVAKIFGWSTLDTIIYLGPFVTVALIIISSLGYMTAKQTEDSHVIRTKPIWKIDLINLFMWANVLYWGVFSHESHAVWVMVATVVISVFVNLVHIFFRPRREEDGLAHNNPFMHLFEQVGESVLIFGFLASMMFAGDMIKDGVKWASLQMPQNGFLRVLSLLLGTNGISGGADNAFATYQLGPIAHTTAERIAVALSSLDGGILTIIGNAPNIVIVNILRKLKNMEPVNISFTQWIRYAAPAWIIITLLSIGYVCLYL